MRDQLSWMSKDNEKDEGATMYNPLQAGVILLVKNIKNFMINMTREIKRKDRKKTFLIHFELALYMQ